MRVRQVAVPGGNDQRSGVSASAQPSEGTQRAARLALESGQIVQEIGHDQDCDEDLRQGVVDITGSDMVDTDFDEVVDAALLWYREDDGDLTDALVDAIISLADQGVVWLLTPKPGRDGHVEPEDITEAAQTAGLRQTSTISAGTNWQGTRLVAPKAKR
jgi:hypothetical protein